MRKQFVVASIAATIACAASSSAHAQDTELRRSIKLQNFWNYEVGIWEQSCEQETTTCKRYFTCDYEEETCQNGYTSIIKPLHLYTLLDGNEREIEIGHFYCDSMGCLNFDTGEGNAKKGPFNVTEDMPPDCATTGSESCDLWKDQHVRALGGRHAMTEDLEAWPPNGRQPKAEKSPARIGR
jgi:hypothetical protein